jgi:GAF domain
MLLLTVHSADERLRLPRRNWFGPLGRQDQPSSKAQGSPDMSPYSTLDRESFQNLLANVFAVQESQMDSQSLSAIVEVQRLITSRELDVDGVMRLIVDSARNVAKATGVAIGLLRGDQLVYRAGSGSAATCIGRHVTASLTVSADSEASREILRVENTQTDTRIEAAICRQLGAKSVLILPIYRGRAMAGVLEVMFSEAHAFQDREVRTYRLMAGLIGEAMSHAAQLEQEKNLTTELPTIPRAVEQIIPQAEKLPNDCGCVPGPANRHAICQTCGAPLAVARELPVLRQPGLLATMIMQRATDVTWHKRRWNLSLAAVATVLVLTCWLALSDRRPASPLGSSALPRSTAIEHQVPFLPAKAVPTKGTSKVQPAAVPAKEARTARTMPQRVRVGENEVDYIGEDVTVRYFTPEPAPQRGRVEETQVAHIGEDVTVRYFTPKPAPQRGRVEETRVAHIGEDVTVRYFTPKRARSWPAPAESVSPKPANWR